VGFRGHLGKTGFQPTSESRSGVCEWVGIKYIEGWQEYDDNYGEFRKGGGDGLRRQLTKFKSLREVLLSDGDSEILFVTSQARLL
jgi:hypothetical protein